MYYLLRLLLAALVLVTFVSFVLSGPDYKWTTLALSLGLAIVGARLALHGRKRE